MLIKRTVAHPIVLTHFNVLKSISESCNQIDKAIMATDPTAPINENIFILAPLLLVQGYGIEPYIYQVLPDDSAFTTYATLYHFFLFTSLPDTWRQYFVLHNRQRF